jgi:purine-binding chemotaxis protein CheW
MKKSTDYVDSLAGKYTRFFICGEEYGVKSSQVKAVLKRPKIRKVPKAPAFIEGVANVEGRIVPLLNPLKRLDLMNKIDNSMGDHNTTTSKKPMIMVQLDDAVYGLLVDDMAAITDISPNAIEPMNPLMVESEYAFIAGIAKLSKDSDASGAKEQLVYLLDVQSMITAGIQVKKEDKETYADYSRYLNDLLKTKQKKPGNRYLTFHIAGETYAILSSKVSAVSLNSSIASPSRDHRHLAGLIETKKGTLPVIDLQIKFDLGKKPYTTESRVIFVEYHSFEFGILANRIDEIIHLTDDEIKQAPEGISGKNTQHIKGIAMPGQGDQMMVVLDENKILTDAQIKSLQKRDDVKMKQGEDKKKKAGKKTISDFLIVHAGDVEFAISTMDTIEVVMPKTIKPIPKAPAHIIGVMPIRGEPISIMQLGTILDIEQAQMSQTARVVVVEKKNARFGLLVETVSEILKVSQEQMVKPPDIVENLDQKYISKMIVLKDSDRSPIILNLDVLMDETT